MSFSTEPVSTPPATRSQRSRGTSVKVFLVIWLVLIGAGIAATYWYSNHLQQAMLKSLDAKWQTQTNAIKADYNAKLTSLSKEVGELSSKVQSFNELLTFTKDNASNKTDNSNKLYTQLNEVKKQLNALQSKMDLLK
ncbi:hypothetical protein [Paenibacillus sp. J22TS3]|uniref:hypothetical protein n=1 Tax=Paenibacillus sp. J22TS3 TaxID=2807192 RepID=UPI001B011A25|nr:hypothetical protein [Paenibacillus sp. J22TS3]GIP24179.1 hypothetical protein J22TS3_44540 [Paenibacillus sp. J22TS3]